MITIYTDGSIKGGNPGGHCGAGVVVYHDGTLVLELSIYLGKGTNNTAELAAVLIALRSYPPRRWFGPVVIYTDSQYVIGATTKNWETKRNSRLIRSIKRGISSFSDVQLEWVRGHDGNAGNEAADRLAKEASAGRRSRVSPFGIFQPLTDVMSPPEHALDAGE